jgi:iron complex transport system permease protein
MTLEADPGRGAVLSAYKNYVAGRRRLLALLPVALLALGLYGVWAGSYRVPAAGIVEVLLGRETGPSALVIWNIRLPRIAAAMTAGWGLAISGAVIQTVLRNPLASPFTLGISHAAAFGAAFAIIALGAGGASTTVKAAGAVQAVSAAGPMTIGNVYSVTFCAFAGAMIATGVILLLAQVKKMSAEAVILAGVALSSLFVSATILIQYFGTEVEIASVVFWTFGDVGRVSWKQIAVMSSVTALVTIYFHLKRWDLNSLLAGEDTARSLGVPVNRFRMAVLVGASLVAALVTAFLGVIAFLGLLAPHIARMLVGGDHRFLIPYSCLIGAFLLLLADTVGRTLVSAGTLPVGVITSFMGAPLFLFLLLRGQHK